MNFKRLERGLSNLYSRAAISNLKGRSPNIKSIPPTCTITFPCRPYDTATTKPIPIWCFHYAVGPRILFQCIHSIRISSVRDPCGCTSGNSLFSRRDLFRAYCMHVHEYWNPQPHGDCTGQLGLLEVAVATLTPDA